MKALLLFGLLLSLAMFPGFVATTLAIAVLAGLTVCVGALLLSVLFAPPRPR